MNENTSESYIADHFQAFDQALRDKSNAAWGWLELHLRQRFQAWILQRIQQEYPQYSYARLTIKEEVYALSLLQLTSKYPQFKFDSFQKLKSLYFRIGELQFRQYMRQHFITPSEVTEDFLTYQADAQMFRKLQNDEQDADPRSEEIRLLDQALSHLSDEDQTLLKMYMLHRSYDEIAKALNLNTDSVRKRKSRIVKQLKTIISKLLHLLLLFLWI